jgi:hypothetical protein
LARSSDNARPHARQYRIFKRRAHSRRQLAADFLEGTDHRRSILGEIRHPRNSFAVEQHQCDGLLRVQILRKVLDQLSAPIDLIEIGCVDFVEQND